MSPPPPAVARRRTTLERLAIEAWPLLIVAGLTALALWQVSASDWKEIFLYNGDSIVLPLLSQSYERGEPFHWIFSTQTFLFPEYPLFWLCSVITGGSRAALILNAVVNVLLLYGLLRLIARFVAPGRILRQVAFTTLAMVLFLACVLSEPAAEVIPPGIVNYGSITTLFLLTTYYYGVILVGLGTIALVLWFTGGFTFRAWTRRRVILFAVSVGAIGSLTMYSNPLYLLQVVLPLGVALLLLLVARRLPPRWFIAVLAPLVIATSVGGVLRLAFGRYLSSDFRSYVGLGQAWQAFERLLITLSHWAATPVGIGKMTLLVLPVAGLVGYAVYLVTRYVRLRRRGVPPLVRVDTLDAFLVLFVSASAVSLLLGHIVTGQLLTRYLVPLFIFPLLGVLLLAKPTSYGRSVPVVAARRTPRFHRTVAGVAIAGAVLAAIGIGVSARPVAAMATEEYEPAECLDDWLAGSSANGVGPFMVVRPIMLYGEQSGRILQVLDNVVVQPWMNNLALYDDTRFSYVLIAPDRDPAELVEAVGEPASITQCPTFAIYDYAGTPGEETLNDWIGRTLGIANEGRF